MQHVPGNVVVVDHHDPEAVVDEPLEGGQLLLLNLIVVNGFKGDTPMAPFSDPGVEDVFVDQALDRADRKLKQFSGFAGAAASGGGVRVNACLLWKASIYR